MKKEREGPHFFEGCTKWNHMSHLEGKSSKNLVSMVNAIHEAPYEKIPIPHWDPLLAFYFSVFEPVEFKRFSIFYKINCINIGQYRQSNIH